MSKQLDITRRRILGGLGTIGVASAAAGLGTSAYLNDTESFEDNSMTAGTLDLKVGWQQIYYGPNEPSDGAIRPRTDERGEFINANPDHDGDGQQSLQMGEETYTWNDGGPTGSEEGVTDHITCDSIPVPGEDPYNGQDHLVELGDVKPGDGGQVTFNLCLCDNPGYIWLMFSDFSEGGGVNPEPEQEAEGDSDNDANLAENMNVYVSLDENCNSRFNDADTVVWSGTLAEARATVEEKGPGLMLREDCFEAGCHCVNVGWEVPTDVENEIQGDMVEFDLGFYTEQCRHNPEPTLTDDSTEKTDTATDTPS